MGGVWLLQHISSSFLMEYNNTTFFPRLLFCNTTKSSLDIKRLSDPKPHTVWKRVTGWRGSSSSSSRSSNSQFKDDTEKGQSQSKKIQSAEANSRSKNMHKVQRNRDNNTRKSEMKAHWITGWTDTHPTPPCGAHNHNCTLETTYIWTTTSPRFKIKQMTKYAA